MLKNDDCTEPYIDPRKDKPKQFGEFYILYTDPDTGAFFEYSTCKVYTGKNVSDKFFNLN